jgi:uncharacterized protein
MLLEFSVGNFLSFKDKKTLSMEATAISDYNETNVVNIGSYRILKSAVIYGANSSGKSNLIKAFSQMKEIVSKSASKSSTDKLVLTPFLLNDKTEKKPSFFEVVFLLNGFRYRYGFEATQDSINTEWLFVKKKNKENPLFIRDGEKIEVDSHFKEGLGLEEKTRNNALFLSVVDQFNGVTAKQIIKWFENAGSYSGLKHDNYRNFSFKMLKDKKLKTILMNFFRFLDLGFDDFELTKGEPDQEAFLESSFQILLESIPNLLNDSKIELVKTYHNQYNDKGKIVGLKKFDMLSQESSGTNKIFDLSGLIINSLLNGSLSVIDELDSKLHPLLTLRLTRFFNSKIDNYRNSQLIFATHDTNLLTYGDFRRDQIYFVEKDQYGASDIYSLAEYKEKDGSKVRKDRSFEKDYIQGRYGAIPFLGDFKLL